MKKTIIIVLLFSSLLGSLLFLTACSHLPRPRNVQQEGWYLRWESDYGVTVEFRRAGESVWWRASNPSGYSYKFDLQGEHSVWRGNFEIEHSVFELHTGDQVRIQSSRLVYTGLHLGHGRLETSRWVTITFVMPE